MPSPTGRKDPLVGQTLSDYVIEERIGTGGMGVVYRAVQPMIGKHVAIKVLRHDVVTDPRDVERLLEEARIVNQIKHRGIINIFGAGSLEDGRHYLIMELLEGEALEQKMAREGRIALPDAVAVLEEVLSALAAAHAAGIVHRDLKPANVFLVNEGGKFFVKLLDFGLARKQAQDFSRIAGTPDYISPEHARGRPAGPPADLYAFGILCFHMLTGQLPFTGNTPMEVMEKHVHSAPPVPHELNPQIPKALSELILKLLTKEPGARPDAQQVKADLRAATKQFRNAATMMSLAQIDAVADSPEASKEEKKRAVELAVKAQVADMKRKVTRRWPLVVGGVVGVWFLAVLAYVFWPESPVEDPTVRPPKNGTPIARVDPKNPKDPKDGTEPLNVKDPVRPPAEKKDAGEAVAVVQPVAGDDAGEAAGPVAEAPDAAVDEPTEDLDAPLDDFRIGEWKKKKVIEDSLEGIEASMKLDPDKQTYFNGPYKKVKKLCDEASTLRQLFTCDDELNKLRSRFFELKDR